MLYAKDKCLGSFVVVGGGERKGAKVESGDMIQQSDRGAALGLNPSSVLTG